MKEKEIISFQKHEERLYEQIALLIRQVRQQAATTINIAMTYTNYSIGKYIVEEEQDGTYRAIYGKQIVEGLALRLTAEFGKGFSTTNLKSMRLFYTIYSQPSIRQTASAEFTNQDFTPSFTLTR